VPQQFLVSSDDGERADFPVLGNRFVLPAEVAEERFALVEHRIALQGRYGLEMDFASVGPLCERHGLTPPGPPPGEG
jgi:hypothetical protein